MNTINDFLDHTIKKYPSKTCIITKEKKLTFSELESLISNVSSYISKFPKQSVISIIFENSVDCIIAYLGILRVGCIAHLIPPSISDENLINQLKSAEPKILVATKNILKRINKLDSINCEKIEISEMYSHKKTAPKQRISSNDLAYLIYTSGTTSLPKGVGITHSNCIFTTKNIINTLDYRNSDVDVLPLSLSHSFGLGCLHTSLFVGSCLCLQKNASDVSEILNSIEKNNATTLAAIPATLSKMLLFEKEKMIDITSKLRLIITNSTSIHPDVVKEYKKILKNGKIATYYGLTEASRSTFMIFNNSKFESVGLPPNGVEIKIVDNKNSISKKGEILIKGNNVIEKYWNNIQANKNLIDGWLRTGDFGYADSEGYLYLLGRLDDVINVAGEKAMPEEIENVVKELSGIDEAIAVPMKHDIFGTVVKLLVHKTVDSKIEKFEILTHCIKNLERYKVPAKIEFIDKIPKTDYGKIKRSSLR